MNKFLATGRLVNEPQIKKVNNNISKVEFRLAIRRDYKNKATNEYESDFIYVIAWRGKADYIAKYYHKGDLVEIEAASRSYPYIDKDGQHRTIRYFECKEIRLIAHPKSQQDNRENEIGGKDEYEYNFETAFYDSIPPCYDDEDVMDEER